MNYVNRFSAAVLAGGKSTRMGADKAGLTFQGMTLAAYQAEKFKALGLSDLMLSGCRQDIPGTRFVPDALPAHGPLSGIHACLGAAEHDAVLFLSVDVPLVPVETLRALLDAHTGGITLLSVDGAPQPLIGVYDKALAPLCRELLESGRCSVRRLLDAAGFTTVEYRGEADLLANCNTPEEYARILSLRPTI